MKHVDINGNELLVGMEVIVPTPKENGTDLHVCEFIGVVSDLLDNGNAIVEDEDIDFFELESNRLKIN